MGLTAIVYRNAECLSEMLGGVCFKVDLTTGEFLPKEDEKLHIPMNMLIADRQRLGNIDEIHFLREKMRKLFKNERSFLIEKVLYSSSHSGDVITVSDIHILCKELEVIRNLCDLELNVFLQAMDSLIKTGRLENNPIVFV